MRDLPRATQGVGMAGGVRTTIPASCFKAKVPPGLWTHGKGGISHHLGSLAWAVWVLRVSVNCQTQGYPCLPLQDDLGKQRGHPKQAASSLLGMCTRGLRFIWNWIRNRGRAVETVQDTKVPGAEAEIHPSDSHNERRDLIPSRCPLASTLAKAG